MDDSLLKDEYFHLHDVVESFDAKSLTIKAWSVTLITTGLGAANLQGRPALYLVAAGGGLLFWLIETMWKGFQYAYYPRIREIESHFAGKSAGIAALQINAAWSTAWHENTMKQFVRQFFWPHVMLPHAVTVLAGLLLYVSTIARGA